MTPARASPARIAVGTDEAPHYPGAKMPTAVFTHPQHSAADVARLLAANCYEIAVPVTVTRTILDSFDGRLHEAGLRLELQRGVALGAGLHLALSAAGSISATVAVKRSPRFATDLPSGPFRPRLTPALEMRALLPSVSFTDVVTDAVERDDAGKTVVTISIHEPIREPFAGGAGVARLLVEVIELVGHRKPASRAQSLLERLGCERLDNDLIGFVLEAAGVDPAGYNSSPSVPLDPHLPAILGFRAVFENLASTIDANWRGTIDDIDTEFLHELRVAIRRTRSVLGHGKGVVPDLVRDRYCEEFAWLAALTGPTRDRDVYILEWGRYVGHLSKDRIAHLQPVLLHLQRHRATSFRELVKDLQSDRAQTLLAEWGATLRDPEMGPDPGVKADRPLHRVVSKRIRDAHQALVDNGRCITAESPAEALHDLRKDAKKLRYAIECFGGLLPNAERKAFVRQLKGLQDNLGEHQDAEVHSAELQAVANEIGAEHATPDTLVALGALTEHLQIGQGAARSEFVDRFAAYDSKETREILARLLQSIDRP